MLSEAMLACAGVINRLGSINNGTTVSDYHESERDHKISVHASLCTAEWQGKKFNIIDTPGYLDFISEGLGALRVGDFALIVVHANHGVGVGTDQVWSYATDYGIPKMFVINAADKRTRPTSKRSWRRFARASAIACFPMTIPINAGPGFNQVLDVMRSEIMTFPSDNSGNTRKPPPPANGRIESNSSTSN